MAAPRVHLTYLFDSGRYEPFELGAKLIATVAFPGAREIILRERAFEALCAKMIHATCAADPANADLWRARFPAYAAMDESEIRWRLKTLRRRLRDRMTAACMAMGYLDEALRRMFAWIGEAYPELKPEIGDVVLRPTPLPDGVTRHSLNALTQFHFPIANEEGRHNHEHRVWRPSLPVIHLAVALHVLGRHLQLQANEFPYNLQDAGLHRRVLALAEVHEAAVDLEWERRSGAGQKGGSTFTINPAVLIRCRAEKLAA